MDITHTTPHPSSEDPFTQLEADLAPWLNQWIHEEALGLAWAVLDGGVAFRCLSHTFPRRIVGTVDGRPFLFTEIPGLTYEDAKWLLETFEYWPARPTLDLGPRTPVSAGHIFDYAELDGCLEMVAELLRTWMARDDDGDDLILLICPSCGGIH